MSDIKERKFPLIRHNGSIKQNLKLKLEYIIPAKFYLLWLITKKVRSENGYGFLQLGLKTGVGNGIFWSEIGSGFGDAGGTPPPKIPRSTPPPGSYPL